MPEVCTKEGVEDRVCVHAYKEQATQGLKLELLRVDISKPMVLCTMLHTVNGKSCSNRHHEMVLSGQMLSRSVSQVQTLLLCCFPLCRFSLQIHLQCRFPEHAPIASRCPLQ